MKFDLISLLGELSILVEENDFRSVEQLIRKTPILRESSVGDSSALQIVRDIPKMLEIALNCGVDPNLRDSTGNTLLMDCSGMGDLAQVEMLLKYSADVNARNHSGESPLSIAVARGQLEVAKKLKEAGADTKIRVGGVNLSTWAELSESTAMQSWVRGFS